MAKDEYGLTSSQRAFADEYIRNKGNATQAYLFAYPHIRKESTAAAAGARLLRNVKVSKYIADRTKEILDKQKMGQDEIITTLTSIARREVQESYSKTYNHLTGEVEKEVTYTFQPTLEDVNNAVNTLVKFLGTPTENEKAKIQIKKMEAEIESMSISDDREHKIDKFLDLVEGELDE
ncbi:terminase small subunit [uncultured Anaerococcus sp.]|uniref:terminase small subunit n=1 Tax=uncultured Anaerococcus sp. TaxID=293428 RepID=UPI00262141DF|nr:terminase small subunit [uncultured Anaerococcus sp.]